MARIFLSAGEASGEHYGALLIESLRKIDPSVEIFGMGGQRMEALGCRRVVRSEDMAVMGLSEVVRHLPHLYRQYRRIKKSAARDAARCRRADRLSRLPPSLAKDLHRLGIPVIYFRQPATMGVEEASHPQGEKLCGPHAGDLSLRGKVLSRTRRERDVCRPSARRPALARDLSKRIC